MFKDKKKSVLFLTNVKLQVQVIYYLHLFYFPYKIWRQKYFCKTVLKQKCPTTFGIGLILEYK